MTFLLGLEQLGSGQKARLLAQLRVLRGWTVMWEQMSSGLLKAGQRGCREAGRLLRQRWWKGARALERMAGRCERQDRGLPFRLEREQMWAESLSEEDFEAQWHLALTGLAGLDASADLEAVGEALLRRAARSLKIDPDRYVDTLDLEDAVFEQSLRQTLDSLKKELTRLEPEQASELEELLEKQLNELQAADREAMARTLGLKELSGRSLLRFVRTTSTVAIAQGLLGAAGFQLYMALVTVAKGVGLLLGTTLPFGVFVGITSGTAFLLSAPALFGISVLSGAFIGWESDRRLRDNLAASLVTIGRSALLADQ